MKDFPDYARKTAGTLLDRVAFQVHRVARMPKPDSIHDLRGRKRNECVLS